MIAWPPAVGAAMVVLLSAACTPATHGTEPYRSEPELARTLEQRAAQVCAERRGQNGLPPRPF
ncbi:MAG: hypothetical protein ACYSVY_25175, partial [Planctomycetota bacterium]